MQSIKSALKWIFGTSEGHSALLFTMFAACGVGAAFGVPHAYEGVVYLVPGVLVKLKS